jgi:APA family basic amino acid/polyamine antiporter
MADIGTRKTSSLVRVLGTWGVAASIVNITIGGGIFRLPAAAASLLGAAAPIAYLVCAITMGLVVLCMAEAASRVTVTGGPYAYVEVAFGAYPGFITGVMMWLLGTTACAAIATVFSDNAAHFMSVFASPVPRALLLVAVLGTTAAVNLFGVRQGNRLNVVTTIAKVAPLLLLIAIGVFSVRSQNLVVSTMPSVAAITRTSIVLVFAFAGVESALVPGGEVRDPARTWPRAIFMAMIGITLLYIVLQLVTQGVLGNALATSTTPLADAAGIVFGDWGRQMLLIAVLVSMFGFLSGMALAVPRALFALARDGFLPRPLAAVHPRWRTPYVAIVVQAVVTSALAITSGFGTLAVIANVAALLVYLACAGAAWELRRRRVQGGGIPFNVPGATVVPLLTMAVIVGLLTSITLAEWTVLFWVVVVATVMFVLTVRGRERRVQGDSGQVQESEA